MMKPRRYFPLGKAYGDAFCNRVEETRKLIGNIENGKHSFLLAPRRYGKSSLCEKVFESIDLPWSKLDLYLAITTKDIERIIVNGVVNLIGKSIKSVDKLTVYIKKYAKKLLPKLSIGTKDLRLELEFAKDSHPAETIAEALIMLEKSRQSQAEHCRKHHLKAEQFYYWRNEIKKSTQEEAFVSVEIDHLPSAMNIDITIT